MDGIDGIIVDLNNALKEALNGQYIQASVYVAGVAHKLIQVRNELEEKNRTIDQLTREVRESGREVVGKGVM